MIAAAVEPLEILVALSGVLVLVGIVRRAARGRPLLCPVARPFRPARPGPLVLLGAGLFVVYVASVQLVVSGRLGLLGTVLGIAIPFANGVLLSLHLRRTVLLPRGSVGWRIGMGLLHLWAALPVVLGVFLLCRLFGPEQEAIDFLRRRGPGWQGLAITAVLVAPLAEEVCFRGLLYPALRQRLGVLGSLLATSVLFALIHAPATTWLPLLLLALALGWLVETTGSIVPSIAAHAAFNAIPVLSLLLGGNG